MKVALIGIGGRVGSRLATELLARGHSVTGIARTTSALGRHGGPPEYSLSLGLLKARRAASSKSASLTIAYRR